MIIFDLNPFWIKTSGTDKGKFYENGLSSNKAPSPTHLKSTVFSYRVKQLSKCFNSIEAKLSSRKLRWQFVFLEEKISGFSCTLATSSLFLFSLRFFWGIEAKTLHIFLWKGKNPFFSFLSSKSKHYSVFSGGAFCHYLWGYLFAWVLSPLLQILPKSERSEDLREG